MVIAYQVSENEGYAERLGLEPAYPYNDCLTPRLNKTNETV